jgi:hypothetical protein
MALKSIKDIKKLLLEEKETPPQLPEEKKKEEEEVKWREEDREREEGGEREEIPRAHGRCINMPEEAVRLLEGYKQYMSFLSELGLDAEPRGDIKKKIGEKLVEILQRDEEWKIIVELIEYVRKSS